jgi:hypothetical protein
MSDFAPQNGADATVDSSSPQDDDPLSALNNDDNDGNGDSEERKFFKNLCGGFAYLRRRRDGEATTSTSIIPPSCVLPIFLSQVTVNFIDPTSSSITTAGATMTTTATTLSSSNATPRASSLYEKFTNILERDYACTLTFVPYQLFRNNASGIIENLSVRTVLTKSHGGSLGILPDLPATSDELCDEPYCHVYLAACEGYEHYRTKVKPSLQAFVSQLEAAASKKSSLSSNPSSSSSAVEQSTSDQQQQQQQNLSKSKHQVAPRYVIVYVPTGDKNRVEEMSPKKGAKMSVASRFAAARQRISAVRGVVADTSVSSGAVTGAVSTSTSIAESSTHSGGTAMDSTSENNDAGADETAKNPISQKLTKVERELLRRFKHDFPNGNVCTLSSLVSENPDGADASSSNVVDDNDDREEYLQKLEWNAVLKSLGAAVAAGFQDRCQWFDEELRKLDRYRRQQQPGEGTVADTGESESSSFHLHHFFLVKESLAFTYEQMRLPAEALLQYEELRAFLPEYTSSDDWNGSSELSRMALTGDCRNFREQLRSHCGDFDTVTSAVEKYLFAREISLLFQMHKSIRVILRCLSYAKSLYKMRRKKIEQLNAVEKHERLIEIDKSVFRFCWDIKIASDHYFRAKSSMKTTVDEFFARSLCDLIEFARLRLLSLGVNLHSQFLIHTLRGIDLLEDVKGEWEPWMEPANQLPIATQASFENFDGDNDFLKDALSSDDTFLTKYLQLTKVFADYNEFCGRDRYAARLRIERMQVFSRINDIGNATAELLSIIDVYGQDMWNACHFSLLFRLAAFQRETATPLDYLTTLVRCFGDQMLATAPPRSSEALHDDLESVIQCPSVVGSQFSAATLFGPAFGLDRISIPRGSGTDRNLVKKLYTVGDMVHVTLFLNSFLPKPIEVDSFSIKLVPFRTYVAAMEDHLPLEESDTFRSLKLAGKCTVLPRSNKFLIDWLPKVPGQFIMSSVVILWKGVEFTYTAKELRRPTIRIDVVPCEPTQKIEVKPNYLLPGHEQPISFVFSSGSDVVKDAKLQIVCPPGISLLLPDAVNDSNGWASSYEATLPLCVPTNSVSLTFQFEVQQTEGAMSMQPVLAKLLTSYKYAEDEPDAAPTECMETSLVAKIPALGETALSLIDYEMSQYSVDRCLINIMLRCNTPGTFTVKGWSLDLPKYLSFSDVCDLNECIKGKGLIAGDRVSFGFDCSLLRNEEQSDHATVPAIHVDLVNEYGSKFKETLRLGIIKPFSFPAKLLTQYAITVEILLHSNGGLIGEPIDLVYKIVGMHEIEGVDSLSYQINDKTRDWIPSGKLEGKLAAEPIQIVAIPVTAGRLTNFPSLSLSMEKNNEYIPLKIALVKPAFFDCLSPPSHSSVAFPISSSSRRYSKVPM